MASPNRVKLLASVGFVSLCYVLSSLVEESLYRYSAHGVGRFTATSFLLFFLCLVNVVVAVIGMIVFRRSWRVPSTVQSITVGFSYVGAMYFANESLQYLSYPTQVLGKSCKMIPVMWIGFLNREKSYGVREAMYVLLITLGVNLFLRGGSSEPDVYGLVLLFLSLVLDGITSATQDQLQAEFHLTTHELMFFVNFWGCILSFILAVITGQGNNGFYYCSENPIVLWYITSMAVASAMGQNFIFYMISNVNTLTLSAVTTLRKLITFVFSIVVFKHNLYSLQWLGVVFVFGGLVYELVGRGGDLMLQYDRLWSHKKR